ncbi:MAG TPA: hypothetical protein VH134_14900 [Candidatus Dormibacteraeota bacterium]|jgi:hypothetical protein|nr:hypothetical protein [Candidatus Dormibacteraeota bacterium]
MHRRNHWVAAGLAVVSIGLAGCGVGKADYGEVSQQGPAAVVPVNSTINRVTLTPEAAQKLGVKTAAADSAVMPASTDAGGTSPEISVPVDAVIYDKDGKTWVYIVDGPRSFQRQAVTIKSVEGDTAVLSSGPKPGAQVVTVGAQELLGAELGVAGE